jgi:predicted nucleic acid-binding protein
MRAYVDSDVLIWHLRGIREAADFLQSIAARTEYELFTGALQRAEIIFFMRPEEEEATTLLLSRFKTAGIDQAVVDRAGALYRRWHSSHGIDVNDALLAATVMHTGGKLYTLNVKHYPMPDLLVERAWQT